MKFTHSGKDTLPYQRCKASGAGPQNRPGDGRTSSRKGACMTSADETIIEIGQLKIRYLIDGVTSGAASGMFELTVPPGARVPPPHSHSDNEEIIYCLEGVLRCSVGDEVCDLHPGEKGYTPRGVVHGFSNPFDRPARAL